MENDKTLKIGQSVWATCNELRRRCTIISIEPGRVEVETRQHLRFKVPTTDIVPCMTSAMSIPIQESARREMVSAKHHLDLARQLAKPDPVPPRKR